MEKVKRTGGIVDVGEAARESIARLQERVERLRSDVECGRCDDTGVDRTSAHPHGIPCPKCKPAEHRMTLFAEKVEEARIPKKFRDSKLADYRTDNDQRQWRDTVAAYIDRISEAIADGVGLTLHGSVGTGKTMLASIIGKAAIWNGHKVAFRTERDIFEDLRAAWGADADEEMAILNPLRHRDLLILDDLGVRKPTEYVTTHLHGIIDVRDSLGKPTIVTTNLMIEDLVELYPREVDRLASNEVVEMVGDSMRGVR